MRKTVLITGASGNLGIATVKHFLAEDFNILATVTSEKAKSEIAKHESLRVEIADLTNEEETAKLVNTAIEDYGSIEAALLLVGGYAEGSIANTSSQEIKRQLSLNFDTAYHVARPLFQHMKEKGNGRIVFIGSRPAIEPRTAKNMIAYSLSKSLLFQLAEYLNAEAKGTNVTVTVVVPSTLDTPPNRQAMPNADPAKWVKPEAVADILSFIVSDKASVLREPILKVYNNS